MRRFPRELSRRAAEAARVLVSVPLLAAVAGCGDDPAPPLPALSIDGTRVAVAGLSSGAYMATQAHVAFSDHVAGAALVAGGPWGCAGGTLDVALGPCMSATPQAPDVAMLAARARERADAGTLAPLAGLQGDRVYVLHGTADRVVAPALADATAAFYRAAGGDGTAVRSDTGRDFGHVLPTQDTGVDCVAGGSLYLGRCGFDAAGEALAWLYGEPRTPVAAQAQGELRAFDQDRYLAPDADARLAPSGWLYVPPACAAGDTCGLLVVFHGCEQSAEKVGDTFARDAGFNRWADAHALVVLYPQVRSSYLPLNPKACWDWWGYTGPDYDSRDGAQLRWLAAATAALGAPLE